MRFLIINNNNFIDASVALAKGEPFLKKKLQNYKLDYLQIS